MIRDSENRNRELVGRHCSVWDVLELTDIRFQGRNVDFEQSSDRIASNQAHWYRCIVLTNS
jgi:hypothetical protein